MALAVILVSNGK